MRIVLAFALFVAALAAQQDTMSLTLAEAEKLALEHNPELSTAQLNAQAARVVPLEYKAGLSPQMTGNITGVGADSGSRLAAGGLNNPVVYDRIASGVTLSQLLADFGRTKGLVATANLRADAQDQLTETARADVLVTTVRAYFSVLRANAVLKVAEQTVSERQVVRDKVDTLFRNNLKSGLDAGFANVNLADAQLFLSQARNEVKSAEAALATAIGSPSQVAFSLAEEAMPDALPPSVDPLIRQAIQDRPELKNLRLEQSAAERFTQAEHALKYPTVAAMGMVGVVPAGEAPIPGRYGAAGVNVSIPILNGGLFHARETEAELRAQAAAQRVLNQANLITRDVRTAYLNAATAHERVGLTEQLLTQAQSALELAQGRYDLGLSSIVELSEAQLNLTAAQIANASARYDYQSQRLLIDYQTGALR
jgi:outer membrane protein